MIYPIELFFWCIFAHLISDVLLRTKLINYYKHRSNLVLLFHCLIYAFTICVVLKIFNEFTFVRFGYLVIGHFIIDKFKSAVDGGKEWASGEKVDVSVMTVVDQLLHVLQLVIIVFLW